MKKIIFATFFFFLQNMINAQTDLGFQRCKSLGKSINLSWLENYWNGDPNQKYANYIDFSRLPYYKKQIKLIKQLGYSSVRLPVCFDIWEDNKAPYTIDYPKNWEALDSVVKWTGEQKLKVIIVNHHAKLSTANFQNEIIRLETIWKQVANRYKNTDPEHVYFEMYNEPWEITASLWQIGAQSLTTAVRNICPNHSIVIGGVDWNSINGLKSFSPLIQKNIIYTFHFYDPFVFTHQGAEWVGDPVATVGVPFPYNASKMPILSQKAKGTWGENAFNDYKNTGNATVIKSTLQQGVAWGLQKNVPVFCGEWGSYQKADEASRCNHMNAVFGALESLNLVNAMWEFDQGFSFFYGGGEPSTNKIPNCMASALKLLLNTSDKELIDSDLAIDIYPNPLTYEALNISQKDVTFEQLHVYNVLGQLLKTIDLQGQSPSFSIDLPLEKGHYFLIFDNKTKGFSTIKKLEKL